jgi:hypothetical protein
MLSGATVGCVQGVDDDAGDVALMGNMGRSAPDNMVDYRVQLV